MDISQLIRLLKRHILLLLIVPVILAVTVYYFTRHKGKIYTSETTIYTGIASGYSIETTQRRSLDYFSIKMQFDNLINLIHSRQTISQTSIRLLAQHLSLEHCNTKYISKRSYDELYKIVPEQIKDLVVKNNKSGEERKKDEQVRALESQIKNLETNLKNKKNKINKVKSLKQEDTSSDYFKDTSSNNTNTEPPQYDTDKNTYHIVQYGESLSSISSKYGISIGELKDLNNISDNSVAIGEKLIINKKNSLKYNNNLTANKKQLRPKAIKTKITSVKTKIYTNDPIIPPGVRPTDYEQTVNNFTNYYTQNDTNFIYGLLNYNYKHYSIKAISSKAKIFRVGNSDLIRVTYQSDDPGISQQTLKILTKVFIKNYKELKEHQTDAVVKYFQDQVNLANERLRNSEDRLLNFNQSNNIINYYEQSKYIAIQKEDLDRYYQNEQIRLSAAAASLNMIESKLTVKDSIYLKSDEISKKRDQLSNISEKIAINQISNVNDPYANKKLIKLKAQAKKLKDEIKLYVDQLFLYSHTTEGIPIKNLLTDWLKNAITYEEAKASLSVLSNRKLDFLKTYQIFAPLGATLKRIEREISIEEKSYIELLRSLNLAKMKQQDLAMSNNIRIVDFPFYPLSANPSKTKLLILLAALIGFILVASIILAMEYFDTTIKTPERAEKLTKLKIAGAYPLVLSNNNPDFHFITNRLIEIIIQNIILKLNHGSKVRAEKPYIILIFSTKKDVGKTLILNKIIEKLISFGNTVLSLNYTKENNILNVIEDNNLNITYPINNKYYKTKNIKELVENKYLRRENYKYDYIFIEIPSIIYTSYPLDLMESVDASLLIVKASDHWQRADISALNTMEKVSKEDPLVVLNQAELFALEDIVNGIPKTNKGPGIIKKIISYPFHLRVTFKVLKDENQ